jgi:hypothetical protein
VLLVLIGGFLGIGMDFRAIGNCKQETAQSLLPQRAHGATTQVQLA